VGLDPRWDWLPSPIIQAALARSGDDRVRTAWAFESFGRQLIDIVAPLVPALKPQVAFFEALGPAGLEALCNVMVAARRAGMIVIADTKRGDIGSTAEAYAAAWLAGEDPNCAPWPADALTVNPYLGVDSLAPFVHAAATVGGGVYVLVRTSNPGAADFQDRGADGGRPLYEVVGAAIQELSAATVSHPAARSTSADGSGYGCVGAVVGATWPGQLTALRQQMPQVPLLIPGYGAQGGSAADVAGAFDACGHGALVNSSRAINFAWRRPPYDQQFGEARWQEAVEAATRDMIADLAAVRPTAVDPK
jgi:orotidine-5'-phosphate decarboxylase